MPSATRIPAPGQDVAPPLPPRMPARPAPQQAWPLDEAAITVSPLDYDGAVRVLRHVGVVLLRGALGTGAVAAARQAAEQAFARLPAVMQEQAEEVEHWLGRLSMIAPGLSPEFSDLLPLARQLVEDGIARPILERYFGSPILHDPLTLRFRSHRPTQRLSFVPLHQDVTFTEAERSWINAWVPLTPCGQDAPGLQVFPLPQPAIFRHSGGTSEDGYPMSCIPEQSLARYPHPLVPLEPAFQPGDLLLFDGYCPHRTVERPGMTRTRFSFEFRYTGESSRGLLADRLRHSLSLV